MPSYAAFLGHQPHISIAELSATIPNFTIDAVLESAGAHTGTKDVVLFHTTETVDERTLLALGGTIALARQIEGGTSLDLVPSLLNAEVREVRGKVTFGLRTFGVPPPKIKELYRRGKELLKKQERPVRYVGSERQPAPPILLHDEGLLSGKHGCEIAIIMHGKKDEQKQTWIGRTFAAQDIEAYVKRDMGKPVRDTGVGLLPPKLAQILLNFGAWLVRTGKKTDVQDTKKKPEPLTVFDPFCGTGVIPMECMLRGWHVLASDVSLKAVNGTNKNIEWLRKQMKILKKDVESEVWKQDARKPFDLATKPDVIVTETSLGPNLTKRPTQKEAEQHRREAEQLQADFLRATASSLPGIPLALTLPVWYVRKEPLRLEKIWDVASELGYTPVLPPEVTLGVDKRMSLIYRRPDQFVGREIVLLRSRK